jgi:cyclic lactone autoinducer peptide
MNGSIIAAILEVIARSASYSVSIAGFHQPKEPSALKEKKN